MYRTLLINPGSTSTEVAIFEDEKELKSTKIVHPIDVLRKFPQILDQLTYRREIILTQISRWRIKKGYLAAVVGRSALRGREAGTYEVNQKMIDDVIANMSRVAHAAGLGCMLAKEIADTYGIPAFVAHSNVASFSPIAKVSGIPLIERRPTYHVQNIEGVARLTAKKMHKDINKLNLVIAHLEGGMSIAAIAGGRLLDVTSAFEEGPFTTERAGTLPTVSLVELCFSGKYSRQDVLKMMRGEGGMVAYLNTNKIGEVEKMIRRGDEKAKFYLEAMCYQIAKDIGAMSTVLKGKVDAVILTGKLLESKLAVKWIGERVRFIAPIKKYPEQESLIFAQAALRVLRGEEKAKNYK